VPVCETDRWRSPTGYLSSSSLTLRRCPGPCTTVGVVEGRDRNPAYQPLTLARLSALLVCADESRRWRLVAEFLEEYRWEPSDARYGMLAAEPPSAGDERWDVLSDSSRGRASVIPVARRK
jgi:hypothetical protein